MPASQSLIFLPFVLNLSVIHVWVFGSFLCLFIYFFISDNVSLYFRCSCRIATDGAIYGMHWYCCIYGHALLWISIQFLEMFSDFIILSLLYRFISLQSFYIRIDFIWIGFTLYLETSSVDLYSISECSINQLNKYLKWKCALKNEYDELFISFGATVLKLTSTHNGRINKSFSYALKFNIECFKEWMHTVCASLVYLFFKPKTHNLYYCSECEHWAAANRRSARWMQVCVYYTLCMSRVCLCFWHGNEYRQHSDRCVEFIFFDEKNCIHFAMVWPNSTRILKESKLAARNFIQKSKFHFPFPTKLIPRSTAFDLYVWRDLNIFHFKRQRKSVNCEATEPTKFMIIFHRYKNNITTFHSAGEMIKQQKSMVSSLNIILLQRNASFRSNVYIWNHFLSFLSVVALARCLSLQMFVFLFLAVFQRKGKKKISKHHTCVRANEHTDQILPGQIMPCICVWRCVSVWIVYRQVAGARYESYQFHQFIEWRHRTSYFRFLKPFTIHAFYSFYWKISYY